MVSTFPWSFACFDILATVHVDCSKVFGFTSRATGWKGGANPHDVLKSILASSLKYSFAHAPPLPLGYGKFSLVESPAWPAKKHALLTHTEDKAQNPLGRWVTVRETRDSRIPLPKKNEAFNSSGVTYTKTWLPAY